MELNPEELSFFEGSSADKIQELELYLGIRERLEEYCPGAAIRVQKTQISLMEEGRVFCILSLPPRGLKGGAKHAILLSFSLLRPLEHSRIAACAHPTPRRWTHHVLLEGVDRLDRTALAWLDEARSVAAEGRLHPQRRGEH